MKKRNMRSLVSCVFLSLSVAHATPLKGGEGGGGGGAFVCRGGDVIHSAQMQDVWEAKFDDNLVLTSEGSMDPTTQSEEAEWDLSFKLIERLKLVSPQFYKDVLAALSVVKEIRSIEDVKLKPRGDSGHVKSPFDCTVGESDYLPVAIYEDEDNKLTYSQKVWEKFTTVLERAVTNVHEAVYRVLRVDYGDPDSDRTRKITGRLAEKVANLSELRKWVPLSEFNPHSSKSYSQKYDELVLAFNQGKLVTADDLNQAGEDCHVIRGDLLAAQPIHVDTLKLIRKKAIELKGRKKPYLSGFLAFKDSESNVFTTFPKGEMALIIGQNRQEAYGYGLEELNTQNEIVQFSYVHGEVLYKPSFLVRKDIFGNIIFAARSLYNGYASFECLRGNLFTCKEYKKFDILQDHPNFRPGAMIFCPRKK